MPWRFESSEERDVRVPVERPAEEAEQQIPQPGQTEKAEDK